MGEGQRLSVVCTALPRVRVPCIENEAKQPCYSSTHASYHYAAANEHYSTVETGGSFFFACNYTRIESVVHEY